MLCPKEGCQTELIATIEKFSTRINRHLVRVGFWECVCCGFTKPLIQKQIEDFNDRLIHSISCHCCNDTGTIHHHFVDEYILAGYSSHDPPVPCKRCRAGMTINNGWDIATREDCDRIHRLQIGKVFQSTNIQERVSQLSERMTLPDKPSNKSNLSRPLSSEQIRAIESDLKSSSPSKIKPENRSETEPF